MWRPLRGMVVYGPWACITLLFLRAGIFSSFFIGSYVENSMNIGIDDLEKNGFEIAQSDL